MRFINRESFKTSEIVNQRRHQSDGATKGRHTTIRENRVTFVTHTKNLSGSQFKKCERKSAESLIAASLNTELQRR